MSEKANAQRVSELLNEIFDLNLDWDDLDAGLEISRKEFETLALLTSQLMEDVDLVRLWRCVLLLDSLAVRRLYEMAPTGEFQLVPLIGQAEQYIREYLDGGGKNGGGIERPAYPKRVMPSGLSAEDTSGYVDQILAQFLEKEGAVLCAAGLNQASMTIVVGALRKRTRAIKRNIINPPTLRAESLTRLGGQLKDVYSVEAENRRGRLQLPEANSRNLTSTKTKLVAFATLWGDALPLLLTKDWSITSVLSTVSGATVAGIFPDR